MKKLFISQPMRGKTDEQILAERELAVEKAEKFAGEKVDLIDIFFGTSDMTRALEFLGESIKRMAQADIAYFASGWEEARGCRIEHECAEQYNIPCIID